MGIMLKSQISLTRTTPAYKLLPRQCPGSYCIFYRIYICGQAPGAHSGRGPQARAAQHDCGLAGDVGGLSNQTHDFANDRPGEKQFQVMSRFKVSIDELPGKNVQNLENLVTKGERVQINRVP
ncbi:uncharacterized protein Dana_GF23061, isoform B [Drosophila ananassae]|uniref:Uncharacterized protein, isoform B n=1 Tax=Drosophila ananassae TaxID=7217 RepID=B3MTT4_DROAN|nr:uncharacterized protein LOC6505707 [Drosophila ananassae]EDV30215.2 uncharacterized protein Dana_GF23061, isoform B [Drosophila ananassae]